MFNMTENEPTTGWEGVKPSIRPINRLFALSLSAWKLASKWADEGRDWDDIKQMQDTAVELEKLALTQAECNCFLPEQSCEVCRAATRVIYSE